MTGASANLCAAYLQAQLCGDRREALRLIVDELQRGLSPRDAHRVLQEAQSRIGQLWQEDRITVAQEHMATAISQVVLSHVYQHADAPAANGRKVLVACVEGELHDFPARLVADALDLAGFEVRFLGANVPAPSLLQMLDEEQPDLLVLSATMTFNVPQLRSTARAARAHRPGLPMAIGGAACEWSAGLVAQLGAEDCGRDAEALVRHARRLLGVQP